MNRTYLIIGAILLILCWNKYHRQLFHQDILPPFTDAKNSNLDPCYGKKMCAVAYVAPWCPACEQLAPIIQGFVKKYSEQSDYGILVIIGAGTAEENEKKAKFYESNTLIDQSFKMSESLGVTYYPSFFVVDAYRKVKLKDQEAFNWMQEHFQ